MALFDEFDKEFGFTATVETTESMFSDFDKEFGFTEQPEAPAIQTEMPLESYTPEIEPTPMGTTAIQPTIPQAPEPRIFAPETEQQIAEEIFTGEGVEEVEKKIKPGIKTPFKAAISSIVSGAKDIYSINKFIAEQKLKHDEFYEDPETGKEYTEFMYGDEATKKKFIEEKRNQEKYLAREAIKTAEDMLPKIEKILPPEWEEEISAAASGTLNPLKNPTEAMLSWATNIANQTKFFVSHVGGPATGFSTAHSGMAEEYLQMGRANGLTDDEIYENFKEAVNVASALEYAGELATLGIAKKIPGVKKLTAPMQKFLGKHVVGKVLGATGAPLLEGLTEWTQQGIYNYYLGKTAKDIGWTEDDIKNKFANENILKSRDFWIGFGTGGIVSGAAKTVEKVSKVAETMKPPEVPEGFTKTKEGKIVREGFEEALAPELRKEVELETEEDRRRRIEIAEAKKAAEEAAPIAPGEEPKAIRFERPKPTEEQLAKLEKPEGKPDVDEVAPRPEPKKETLPPLKEEIKEAVEPEKPKPEPKEPKKYKSGIVKKNLLTGHNRPNFTEDFKKLSAEEKYKAITEEKKQITKEIDRLKEINETAPTLELLKTRLISYQRRLGVGVKKTGEALVRTRKRYIETGTPTNEETRETHQEIVRLIDKIEGDPVQINEWLEKNYTPAVIKRGIADVKAQKKGIPIAKAIRSELGKQVGKEVKATQFIEAVKKTKEELKKPPKEFSFEEDIRFKKELPKFTEETRDIFEGTKLERRKPEQIEIEAREKQRKGGKPDVEDLPFFQGGTGIVGGTQQLSLFKKGDKHEAASFKEPMELTKAKVSPELWRKTNITFGERYGQKGQFSLKKGDKGAIWYDKGRFNIVINPANTAQETAATLFHEVMGHAGAANVLRQNPIISKRMNSLYKLQKNSDLVKRLKTAYKEEMKKDPAKAEDLIYSEWIASNVETHLANPKKQGIAYQVWKHVKQFLIDLGIAKDSVDDVINSMVKEIRKIKDVKGEIMAKPAKAKEARATTFFSPTLKAAEQLKQPKGTPEQMLAMIRKQPGIKPAETEWLGIEEEFAGRKSVTKEEIADFVRANQVEVEESALEEGFEKERKRIDDRLSELDSIINLDEEATEVEKKEAEKEYDKLEKIYKEKYADISIGKAPKYSQYTLPGGKNYKEMLFRMPPERIEPGKIGYENAKYLIEAGGQVKLSDSDAIISSLKELEQYPEDEIFERTEGLIRGDVFRGGHWDEPNVFAHARINERTTPEGDKVLFIEEIQSDWAREAREKGIAKPVGRLVDEVRSRFDPFKNKMREKYDNPRPRHLLSEVEKIKWDELQAELDEAHAKMDEAAGVPDFPFKKNWHEFVLKRLLRYAAENGFDRIAWITGEQTADRYDISQKIGKVEYDEGTEELVAYEKGDEFEYGEEVIRQTVKPDKIGDYIGKEAAERLMKSEYSKDYPEQMIRVIEGEELKMSPQWAKNLYDRMIPKFLDKYAKKWGAKTDKIDLGASMEDQADLVLHDTGPQTSLPITPQMKQSVLYEGQPMFKKAPEPKTMLAKELPPKKAQETEDMRKAIDKEKKAEDALKESYEKQKDVWFGEKDVRVHKSMVEKRGLQKEIKGALKQKKYNELAKRYDKAIQIYIDTKRSPDDIKKYYDKLSPEQKNLVDLSQKLPDNVKAIADKISKSYEETGVEALDAELIKNVLDNYVGRIWDLGEKPSTEKLRRFGTRTRHAKGRKFATIIEGMAAGYDLKVKGATNNLQILKEEIIKTIEDKKFLKKLMKLKSIEGEPLISTSKQEGYVRIEHPNFTTWKYAGKAKEGEVYGKSFFADKDGNLFEKRELYAPKRYAKNLNNILGISKLIGVPGVRTATKYNAIVKAWILQTSLFHHLAFVRSYELGTQHKRFGELSPRQAYKQGIKAIEEESPIVEHLVRNGLTLGLKQDWNEDLLREKTFIGKVLDKTGASKVTKDKILKLREAQADFLFGEFGAGLKAKAAMIEYRNLQRKHPNMDSDRLAKMAANLINDDFGGLHLQRMGRNPTLQHIFRLFALAPDWTESNIRSMVKMVGAGTKEERAMYRRFWAGIATKGVLLTVAANALLSIGSDDPEDKFFRKLKRAWREGGLKFLDVDITRIYKALGGKKTDRKYFSILGHFKDPVKFATHPARSAQHKSSVLYKTFHEALTGVDWAGRRFTTYPELLGIDYEKGRYRTTKEGLYQKGESKAGKLAGKTVSWTPGKKGAVSYERMPSFLMSQLKGTQPVQVQNLISWASGEMEGFDALMNSMGLGVRTTYGGEEAYAAENIQRLRKIDAEFQHAKSTGNRKKAIGLKKKYNKELAYMQKSSKRVEGKFKITDSEFDRDRKLLRQQQELLKKYEKANKQAAVEQTQIKIDTISRKINSMVGG